MRVFVTGASGFIGSWLCRTLIEEGHEVSVLLRNPEKSWRLQDIIANCHVINGDLTAIEKIEDELALFSPEAICHLGWQGVSNIDRNNLIQLENVADLGKLFSIAERLKVNSFVALGSQAEYGPVANKISPNQATKPSTLYGQVKLNCSQLGSFFAVRGTTRFAWLRVFSTYGAMDHPYWMIPYLINQLLNDQVPKLTKGEQLWDFLYVQDAVRAIIAVLNSSRATGIYNLGSGSAPSLRSTIEIIRNLVNPDLSLGFGDVAYRPDQVMHLEADISSLTQDTGWVPEVKLDQGLAQTVDWYRSNEWIFKDEQ